MNNPPKSEAPSTPSTTTCTSEASIRELREHMNCLNAYMDLDGIEAGDPQAMAWSLRSVEHLKRLLNLPTPSDSASS